MDRSSIHSSSGHAERIDHAGDDVNLPFLLIDYAFRQLAKGSVIIEIPGPLRGGHKQFARLRLELESDGEGQN